MSRRELNFIEIRIVPRSGRGAVLREECEILIQVRVEDEQYNFSRIYPCDAMLSFFDRLFDDARREIKEHLIREVPDPITLEEMEREISEKLGPHAP